MHDLNNMEKINVSLSIIRRSRNKATTTAIVDFSLLEPAHPLKSEFEHTFDNNEKGYLGQRSGGKVYLVEVV